MTHIYIYTAIDDPSIGQEITIELDITVLNSDKNAYISLVSAAHDLDLSSCQNST